MSSNSTSETRDGFAAGEARDGFVGTAPPRGRRVRMRDWNGGEVQGEVSGVYFDRPPHPTVGLRTDDEPRFLPLSHLIDGAPRLRVSTAVAVSSEAGSAEPKRADPLRRTHCRKGHSLKAHGTIRSNGYVECRRCHADAMRTRRQALGPRTKPESAENGP